MQALDLTPFEYKLKKEHKHSDATIFELRSLSGMEMLELLDAINLGEKRLTYYITLKYGLLGWKNFKNKKGNVPFDSDMSKNISVMDMNTMRELFEMITERSRLTEPERKNS